MSGANLRPRYAIATLGSAGDLHPFLAVARALHEQGEDVRLLSAEPHRDEVAAQGVPFMPILDAAAHQRTLQHPGLWHPIRGFGVLWRHMAVPAIDPTVAALRQLCTDSPRPLRVLASPLTVGARLARELLPLHLSTGHLAPMGLRSCEDPMFMGAWPVPRWLPRPMRQGLWALLDRSKLEPMAAPRLNAWRLAHGLPVLREPVFARWLHAPDQVLGLFPDTFGPMATDWPVPVYCTGFPLYESHATPPALDAALAAFCAPSPQAPPLLVAFPGSASGGRHAALAEAAQHLAQSGAARVLWLGQAADDAANAPALSPRVCKRRWVSLAQVLPWAQAFAHHGGIGSCAQGLAAGVPQVLLPSAYDQFDNGARLRWMHAGLGLAPREQRGPALVAALRQALAAPRRAPPPDATPSRPGAPNAAVQAVCAALSGG